MTDVLELPPKAGADADGDTLPPTLGRYVWAASGRHQAGLSALSVLVFALATAPLEIQRRIIDEAIRGGAIRPIVLLALGYLGVAAAEGALKVVLNVYRAWVSERAARDLRRRITRLHDVGRAALVQRGVTAEGVEVAVVLSEAEAVGGFVGLYVSEVLLQGGILVTVFGYMLLLNPQLAMLIALAFSPQIIFVPMMQRAINRRVQARIVVLREAGTDIVESHEHPEHAAATEAKSARFDVVFGLNMGIYRIKFTLNFLMNLTYHFSVFACLAIGGWYVVNGRADVGMVVAFLSGVAKVNDPWGDIVNWFRERSVVGVKYRLIAEAAARMAAR
jgi:ABC-type multidrug transport system fused ATPase/permease subunit